MDFSVIMKDLLALVEHPEASLIITDVKKLVVMIEANAKLQQIRVIVDGNPNDVVSQQIKQII